MRLLLKGVTLGILCFTSNPVYANEICMYTNEKGSLVQVNSRAAVPEPQRKDARCFSTVSRSPDNSSDTGTAALTPEFKPLQELLRNPQAPTTGSLAAPGDISLDGAIRKVDMNSALGPIELRWPRSVEKLFGRTPERAMAEAALTVSRALKQKAFPPRVRNLRLNWQVVFMDSDPPAGQVPDYLRATCHPGWMTPPANVYVVAQRVSGHCGGRKTEQRVADGELVQLLVHEIGHAVEYYLMDKQLPPEAMRAEGFATWFEAYATDFSSLIPRGSVEALHRAQAKQAIIQNPGAWRFGYTGHDYSRASMYFHGIEQRFGMSGLMRVYQEISRQRAPFLPMVSKELVLKPNEIEELAAKAAGAN